MMTDTLKNVFVLFVAATKLTVSCSGQTRVENHVALQLKVPVSFRFVAFGDPRFHDPADTEAANASVRQALVAAIDKENPAFVSIGGDVVYNGYDIEDWQVWDTETARWREHKIPIYPAIGNHDLHGNLQTALDNYFARFPELKQSRYYSVRLGNTVTLVMLVLDSALDESAPFSRADGCQATKVYSGRGSDIGNAIRFALDLTWSVTAVERPRKWFTAVWDR